MFTPSLAKLTSPTPARVFPRARLFDRLEAARRGRVIWISAPAGSGKTTAVASYLADRGINPLWYHLDAGDGDPASLFTYLSLAARQVVPEGNLPSLTGEYLSGLDAFSRNYFRALFQQVGERRVLVFDDYHEIAPDSPLHEVMRQGLAEVPEGFCVVVVSRNDPPPALTRLRTQDGFCLLGRDDLLLSAEEAAGVGRLRLGEQSAESALIEQLHRRTQGWVAGLVLMLEQARGQEGVAAEAADGGSPLVFDYLAGEVFDRMRPQKQVLLMKTAVLPSVTVEAARALSGDPAAGELLETLYRRNYFTVRHTRDGRHTYEYHPLFRQFLLERGRLSMPPEELAAVKRQAAKLLAAAGAIEACVNLLTDTGDWGMLVSLMREHGPALLASGRYRTLQDWLTGLPQSVLDGEPWLQYYLGLARLPYDLNEARGWFEKSYLGFKALGQEEGLYLAWAGAIDTYVYAWNEFRSADWWIREFEAVIARAPDFPSRETEVRVTTAIFSILAYRQPQHPLLALWLQRLKTLLFQDIDPALRMTAANYLVLYLAWWLGDLTEASELLGRLQPFADDPAVGPLPRIAWQNSRAACYWMTGEIELCLQAAEQGLALGRESGVHVWDPLLLAQTLWAELTSGRIAPARELFRQIQQFPMLSGHLHATQFHYQRHLEAMYADDADALLEAARAGVEHAGAAGVPWAEALGRVALARALLLHDEGAAAEEELLRAEAIEGVTHSRGVRYGILTVRAEHALRGDDPAAATAAVRALFELMRRKRFANSTLWHTGLFAELCAYALAHGIETEYVRHLIRLRQLEPAGATSLEQWPWPVRLYTLGRFEIVLGDEIQRGEGKSQKRPLELLKALLAFGGRQVPETRLVEALWPDAEGDAGHHSFVTTLQRLRKLLGSKDLLIYREGQLSLDERQCWVDAWAFEHDLPLPQRLALYQGPFLDQETDALYAVSLRERLRRLFIRNLLQLGTQHEAQNRWSEAIALYETGLKAEEYAEEFYQQLMICYARLGQRSEVVATYHRCQKVLALHLNLHPSQRTQSLHLSLIKSEA